MIYRLLRPAVFALDPESAHRLAFQALQLRGLLPVCPPRGAGVTLMGLRFPNRVGLAAGLDKDAEAVAGLGSLGFGFLEIGTVTPRPQPGRPRPRLFRLEQSQALINRLGFPSAGADAVAGRLHTRRYAGVLGVNIGKNADTPIERAADDYLECLRKLHAVADYITVNISSPNTAALRELHMPEKLEPLLSALLAERELLRAGRPLPLLLKLSPDLDPPALESVARVVGRMGIDGLIAANTTVSREPPLPDDPDEAGGLSGPPLHARALAVVSSLRRLLPQMPIIGLGGIDSGAAASAMRAAGADLVQLYTGLIYRGPELVPECVRALEGGGALAAGRPIA